MTQVEKGFALSASEELVACACNNGLVKLISAGELECAGVLSMAEQYHFQEDSYVKSNERDLRSGAGLPDAVACQFLKLEKIGKQYLPCSNHEFHLPLKHVDFCSCCLWRSQPLYMGHP